MSLPVGKTIVTKDEVFEAFVREQANQLAKKHSALAGDFLKKQADDSIRKCHSLNDQSKDISKHTADASIDTCVNLTAKKVIDAGIDYLRKPSSGS